MKVLVIEPCYFGLGYLRALKEMSISCIVATSDINFPDMHGYRDLVEHVVVCDVSNPNKIQSAIKEINQLDFISAVVPGNQFVTESAAGFAVKHDLLGLTVSSANLGVHKDKARVAYQRSAAPSLQFLLVKSVQQALLESERIGYPLIVKPTSSASSKGVSLVYDDAELRAAFAVLSEMSFGVFGFQHRNEVLLEEFADGNEFSVELALEKKQLRFAGVTEKWVTAPPYFVELGHVHPARISNAQADALISAAYQAAEALELETGVFHVELKLGKDGPKIIECNPRPGGDHITTDLVPLATGVNLFEMHLDILLMKPVKSSAKNIRGAAVGFVVATEAGEFQELIGMEELSLLPFLVRCVVEKKSGAKIRPPQSSVDRVAYIIVTGDDNEQAVQNLKTAMSMVKIHSIPLKASNEF
ncbi:ATP-grasp domain-containing protein [Vogesella sp. DC21W]|uniref:ATP-grasp domain-containing protein n=1 Tax=Vogesella aquatica TaxID=2984206 RepID=A0ABT5IY91_9NEIS|nr:ATP-grasp domain-containing protein [Vogesella aquatica]MDC7716584.1 ATP-grasp domain-containing protein [Vogesella aquatica]